MAISDHTTGQPDIVIHKVDEATITIRCSNTIATELNRYFSAMVENYRFMKKQIRFANWDGIVRYFNMMNHELPSGLFETVYEFAKNRYTVETTIAKPKEISIENFNNFVKSLNLPITPRDYQLQAAYDAINQRRLNIKSVTSSGKSLIIYLIIRWMELKNKKVLLAVPSTLLVEQMYSDFEEYGWEYVADKCRMVYSGQKKMPDCPVTISTWQSQYKGSEVYVDKDGNVVGNAKEIGDNNLQSDELILINSLALYDCMIIDEAHLAKAKSISTLSKSCSNAKWRIGCSGTYPEPKTVDWFGVVGSIGPIKEYSSYKQLQEEGHIAQLNTIVVMLEHDIDTRLKNYLEADGDYNKEQDIVHAVKKRNIFIKRLVKKLEQNCLILYTKKEKHGDLIKEMLMKDDVKKKVFIIDGDVDVKKREEIRQQLENENNCVLLATYGTMSTGVSIKNIHHVVFASGYKSRVKVLQSIGRGLRKHHSKEILKLYDLVDDLSLKTKEIRYVNHSMRHLKERIKIYDKEKFDYKIIRKKLEDIEDYDN